MTFLAVWLLIANWAVWRARRGHAPSTVMPFTVDSGWKSVS